MKKMRKWNFKKWLYLVSQVEFLWKWNLTKHTKFNFTWTYTDFTACDSLHVASDGKWEFHNLKLIYHVLGEAKIWNILICNWIEIYYINKELTHGPLTVAENEMVMEIQQIRREALQKWNPICYINKLFWVKQIFSETFVVWHKQC